MRISGYTDFCSIIVERLGSWWALLGWMAFVGWYLGPFLLPGATIGITLRWICLAVVVLWWNIDVTDQQVDGWKIAVGLLLLAIGYLPRGGLLILACWVIYWTRVRE